MEVSLCRSLLKPTNRHILNSLLLPNRHPHPSHLHLRLRFPTLSFPNLRSHFPNRNPSLFSPSSSQSRFARILSGNSVKSFEWKFAFDCVNDGKLGFLAEDKRPAVTVVVLGWLGSKQKHLKIYAEMYNKFGMNAVAFATSVNDVLRFDLGRKFETRVEALTVDLMTWLKEEKKDGRERLLMFHTFSKTGWLAYGSILNMLQGREELLEKIKGCVVDSGGAPELDPKMWAAGFSTAMIKKQSSAVKEPLFIEVLLLTFFEKFFTYVLELPDIKKKLTKMITTLSENQPCCPQIYLYSTADKVIPFQRIESFAENQKKLGRQVTTFNFKSSPHVDHYRTFPDTYTSLVQSFLKDCFTAKDKQLYNVH